MTTDNATPQMQGRDLDVVRIDGPNGPFDIAYAGANSEGEHAFFYRDPRGRFFFYAEFYTKPPRRWDVTRATNGPRSADMLKSTGDNDAVFRENITFFLRTRDWMNPGEPADASVATRPVSFSWKIA
jgi:hypothetical protein